jgi:hypothetical protein
MFTPGSRACAYKSASGLGKWPNRDPLGEFGFEIARRHNAKGMHTRSGVAELAQGPDLYEFVRNAPVYRDDYLGLDCYSELQDCIHDVLDSAFGGGIGRYGYDPDPDNPGQMWGFVGAGIAWCTIDYQHCKYKRRHPGCGDFPSSPVG